MRGRIEIGRGDWETEGQGCAHQKDKVGVRRWREGGDCEAEGQGSPH